MTNKLYLYKLTFPNGGVYFGVSKDVRVRWKNGGKYYMNQPVYKHILKYGWDNIEKEILYEGDDTRESRECVLAMERSLVEIWGNSCYNIVANPEKHPTKGKGLSWTIDGVTKTAVDWCKEYGRAYGRVRRRIERYNLTPKQALSYPSVPKNETHNAIAYWSNMGLSVPSNVV